MAVQTGLDTKPVAETEDPGTVGHVGFCIERSVDGLQVRHGDIRKVSVKFDVAVDCLKLVKVQR